MATAMLLPWRLLHRTTPWRSLDATCRATIPPSVTPSVRRWNPPAPRTDYAGRNVSIQAINESVAQTSAWVRPLQQEIGRVIVGQKNLIDRLLIALVANGHVLLEGVPGLAKTLSLKTLAGGVSVKFQRLQFTPDMLPADIVGTMIYNPQDGGFRTKHGPIFSNLILADEINRAPAKVQSALLEAMQERQVTIGDDDLRTARSVPGAGHAEPARAGRHLSAARSAGGPLHAEGHHRLSESRRGARHSRSDGHAAEPSLERPAGRHRPRTSSAPAAWSTPSTWTTRSRTTSWTWCWRRATRRPHGLDLNGYIQNGASPRATIDLTLAARAAAFLTAAAT